MEFQVPSSWFLTEPPWKWDVEELRTCLVPLGAAPHTGELGAWELLWDLGFGLWSFHWTFHSSFPVAVPVRTDSRPGPLNFEL